MSATIGPDERSYPAEHSENPQDQSLTSQEDSTSLDNPEYVPEREFVLMPLFRRIGEMLGLRRPNQPEYLEAPLPEAARESSTEPDPHSDGMAQAPVVEAGEPVSGARSLAAPAQHEWYDAQLGPDLLDIESGLSEPVAAHRQEAEPEFEADQFHSQIQEPQPVSEFRPQDEPATAPLIARQYETAPEASITEQSPGSDSRESISKPEPIQRRPSAEEIQELVAPLRDAAAKISATVAQAAEWLRTKEEEILRRVEVRESTTPQPGNDKPASIVPFEAHTLIASTPAEPEVVAEAPGIQREAAWELHSADKVGGPERSPGQAPVYRNQDHPALRPRLEVLPPAPPFWRRIDWPREFTPQRVALLGGLAMAVLLVVGVSLARRPAASVLPDQQQTRSSQPGGVTVMTHPAPAAHAPRQQVRRSAAPASPSPSAQRHRTQRSAEYDDGEPEVVTHHYNNQKKTSPVRQTTVAGVRHYSDM